METATQGNIEVPAIDSEILVIHAFMERYDVSFDEASDIFTETKKWLWLASKCDSKDVQLFIDKPLLIIDEMWHNFILHTRLYYKFCLDNFKRLIHHTPTSSQEKLKNKDEFISNPSHHLKNYEEKLSRQYSFIYDHLGPETLLKWYETMAEKYTPEYINSIRKF